MQCAADDVDYMLNICDSDENLKADADAPAAAMYACDESNFYTKRNMMAYGPVI